jgi:broad specificity phosphatase PhoE
MSQASPLETNQASVDAADTGMAAKPGWIVMARHGEPEGDRKVKITWREYIVWWQGYDASGLFPGQTPPEALCALAREADIVFSSTLRRSIETAQAAAHGKAIVSDPIFVEAPLPPPPLPGRFKPGRWGVYARIAWWFGRAAGGESRDQAELRAQAAAATLTAQALRGRNVMLCAHGWFNRMMRPVLLGWGWRCVYDGGDGYWSYRMYERRKR